MSLRPEKSLTEPGSAKKSHKEGPAAGGRMPYELASGKNALRSQAQRRNLIRRDPPQVGGSPIFSLNRKTKTVACKTDAGVRMEK